MIYKVNKNDSDIPILITKLINRCDSCNIKYEILKSENNKNNINHEFYIYLIIPHGTASHNIFLTSEKAIHDFCSIKFEDLILMERYNATVNKNTGEIEGIIERLKTDGTPLALLDIESEDEESKEHITIKDSTRGLELIIQQPSSTIKSIFNTIGDYNCYSIKISGYKFYNVEKSQKLFEKLTNNLFFQKDILHGYTFKVSRQRKTKTNEENTLNDIEPLKFPEFELDKEPSEIYWYARHSSNMPLLQFLAYYQVIEYYFPIYSKEQAKNKIKNILKNPAFRVERDSDIIRIISAVICHASGSSSERNQLLDTISACIGQDEIRQFIESNNELKRVLRSKQKGLSDRTIDINDSVNSTNNCNTRSLFVAIAL